MSEDVLGQLTRKEFLRVSGFALASIPFVRYAWAEDTTKTPIQRLEEILGIGIEVKDWEPVDVTEEVKKALGGRDWKFQEALWPYPHENWTVQSFFRADNNNVSLPQDKYGTHFLCRAQPRKVYTLDFGDDMDGGSMVGPIGVAENGVVTYGIGKEYGSGEKAIVANIHTGKKLIFKVADRQDKLFNLFGVTSSGTGDRGIISHKGTYAVFDNFNYDIIDTREGSPMLMSHRLISYNGKLIMFNRGWMYYLRDVDAKKTMYMTGQEITKVDWVISKNGEYCMCTRWNYDDHELEVFVLNSDYSMKETFYIDHPMESDQAHSIDDDGTVHSLSGTYKYKDGMYHWATEGKEQPKDLKITRVR